MAHLDLIDFSDEARIVSEGEQIGRLSGSTRRAGREAESRLADAVLAFLQGGLLLKAGCPVLQGAAVPQERWSFQVFVSIVYLLV